MLASESDLKELVDRWTEAILPASEWTHAAHVATCSYFAWNSTLAETYTLMKDGLHRFNAATGTPNTVDGGYHETLTRFWCTLLFFKIHRGHYRSALAAASAMVEEFANDSRAEKPYYSFDVLSSREARRRWIAPDVPAEVAREAFLW